MNPSASICLPQYTYGSKIFKIFKILCLVQPPIPEVDLGFALSATSTFHNEIFKLMKDTITYIVETYGTEKIHYSVLVYGDTATTEIHFGQTPPSVQQLKAAIEKLPAGTGIPDLAKALDGAVTMFQDGDTRPLTRKVLLDTFIILYNFTPRITYWYTRYAYVYL